jgi:hypothetical protein
MHQELRWTSGECPQREGGYVSLYQDEKETCKGNLTDLRRILHLSLAKGNPKRTL